MCKMQMYSKPIYQCSQQLLYSFHFKNILYFLYKVSAEYFAIFGTLWQNTIDFLEVSI